MPEHDHCLDALLDLHGTFIAFEDVRYWVKIEARQVVPTANKPHGLDDSLTLHGPDSGDPRDSRLIGFDNAHAVASGSGPGAVTSAKWDHKHRLRTIQPYEYKDAAALLADFWAAVDAMLDERGVKR